MKKIISALFTFALLVSAVHAYDQTDRIKDMQSMESAMAQIQKGILYNNKKLVLQGIDTLKESSMKVEITPKSEMDYSSYFAKRQSENIRKFADKIKKNIEAGHKHGAATNYTKVLDQCISCHNKIRKWN